MEILLLKALREEGFGHKLQKTPSFLSSDLDKFRLEAQLKNLIHIVDKKQVAIKTRNTTHSNNRNDLLHLGFTLKISIFSEVYIKPFEHL